MDLLALAHVTGGVAPFTYAVDGGGYRKLRIILIFEQATTVTVRDANGCEFDLTLKSTAPVDQLQSTLHQPMLLAVTMTDL
jgi:hypothetical protein